MAACDAPVNAARGIDDARPSAHTSAPAFHTVRTAATGRQKVSLRMEWHTLDFDTAHARLRVQYPVYSAEDRARHAREDQALRDAHDPRYIPLAHAAWVELSDDALFPVTCDEDPLDMEHFPGLRFHYEACDACGTRYSAALDREVRGVTPEQPVPQPSSTASTESIPERNRRLLSALGSDDVLRLGSALRPLCSDYLEGVPDDPEAIIQAIALPLKISEREEGAPTSAHDRFNQLLDSLHDEMRGLDRVPSRTPVPVFELPAYRAIIALGSEAVPCIVSELHRGHNGVLWHPALRAIAGTDQHVSDGSGYQVARSWVLWAEQQGLTCPGHVEPVDEAD